MSDKANRAECREPAAGRTVTARAVLFLLCMGGILAWSVSFFVSDQLFAQQDGKAPITMDKAFPNSTKCKRCHERVFEEW